jgi:isopentenyldiphosphate isomerase
MPVSKAQEMCVIVDEDNNVVGAQPRDITVRNRLLGRGSYVLLFNQQKQLFVSKRSISKDVYPGFLDVVISGVVTEGEEYLDTAARELEEEVGVPESAARHGLQQLFIFPYQDSVCHVWGAAFSFSWDGPVSFRDKEVEWGRFMSLQEVEEQLKVSQFTPVGQHILTLYLQQQQQQQQQCQANDCE